VVEAYRQMRANMALKDKTCDWCGETFDLGSDVAVCNDCGTAHHLDCWNQKQGCSLSTCSNAPLKRLEEDVSAGESIPPGRMKCPHCSELIAQSDQLCAFCEQSTSPDGLYHGPKENAPGAISSLIWAIIGLFFCGPILGAVAISQSNKAKGFIALSPKYGGEGLAKAGYVLGIIDIIAWFIVIALKLTGK
jgi:hypothetical protein